MKKQIAILLLLFVVCIAAGCGRSGNDDKTKSDKKLFEDIAAGYFTSKDFVNNFEIKSSGVDYEEVKYLSGDGKEIKGYSGKIKVKAKGNVTDKQILQIAEASLVKYMDNGSSNVVMYECEADDETGKMIKNISVGYADYGRGKIAPLKKDKKSIETESKNNYGSILKSVKDADIKNTRYFFDCLEDGEFSFDLDDKKVSGEWYLATAVVIKVKDEKSLKDMIADDGRSFLENNTDVNDDKYKGVVVKIIRDNKENGKIVVTNEDGKKYYFMAK